MENLVRSDERLDDLQINGYKIIQHPDKFCFGMDAVLLSSFAMVHIPIGVVTSKRNVVDPEGALWRDALDATGQPMLMVNNAQDAKDRASNVADGKAKTKD